MKTHFLKIATTFLFLIAVPSFAAPQTQPVPPADLTVPPAEAERLESGLISLRLSEGSGTQKPAADDIIKVRYTVWNPEGKRLDHIPVDRAAVMAVNSMLPGWREATLSMLPGESRRLWLTPELATKNGKTPAGGYVIETTLIEIVPVPKTPADVAAPPADAETTRSGLASKVLRPGEGTERPKASSQVTVQYTGWTTDGKMFDSSYLHGAPATFPLRNVIKGWTEGLQLMVVGEQRRFWIPAKLAYGDDMSKPQGMLVFDVELLEVK